MIMKAFDANQKVILVKIDPAAKRHVSIGGEEITLGAQLPPDMERQIDRALDDLYDLPMYTDGIITTGTTSHVRAWQDAEPVEEN